MQCGQLPPDPSSASAGSIGRGGAGLIDGQAAQRKMRKLRARVGLRSLPLTVADVALF